MNLKGLNIGFAFTGSFCTIAEAIIELKNLVDKGANVIPIASYSVTQLDTRFTKAEELKEIIETITGNTLISSIPDAEPIGPKALLDALVVSPCTGNTIAKIAGGITDTPVTMAVKAHLRNNRPVILSISTNDGLGLNAKNIGVLLNTKNIYFIPFYQDDPVNKCNSLISKNCKTIETLTAALDGRQLQPIMWKE